MTGTRLVRLHEAAVVLRLSPRQVMRHVESGALPLAAGGGRGQPLQFHFSDLQDFVESREGTGSWSDLGEEIEVLARARGAVEELSRLDWGFERGGLAWIPPAPMSGFATWFQAKGAASRHRAMENHVRKWPKNAKRLGQCMEWADAYADRLDMAEMRWLAATVVAMGITKTGFQQKAIRLLESELRARTNDETNEATRRLFHEHKRLLLTDDPRDFEASWRLITKNWKSPHTPPITAIKAAIRTERASRKKLFRHHHHKTVAAVLGVSRMQEWRVRRAALRKMRGQLLANYLQFRSKFL